MAAFPRSISSVGRAAQGSHWILIRHGRTAHNAQRRLCGQEERHLDYEGRWQAIAAGLALRGRSPPPLLLCSDLQRATQSAGALAAAAGWPSPSGEAWTAHPALRERSMGRWEGRSYDRLRAEGSTAPLTDWQGAPPGGESLAALAARLRALLSPLPDHDGLIVSHAGPIRVLQGLAQGLPLDEIGRIRVANGSALALSLPPGGWAVALGRLDP
jgi:broad specificity phosphatase PhoE